MKVAVVGGGAAGVFAAISQKEHFSESEVYLFEKSESLLSKVKISGGGRCNVTHACYSPAQLAKNYPRGSKFLKKAFLQFSTKDTIAWFETRGVELKVEKDGRMFPVSDNSQTIIDCLLSELKKQDVSIFYRKGVRGILPAKEKLELLFQGGERGEFDKVIIACGGFNSKNKYNWIEASGHTIMDPTPSLFTFNMPGEDITKLMGVSVANAHVHIQSSKLRSSGPLLITHWGMSGPAILKLSAFGARFLHEINYSFKIQLNWLGGAKPEEAKANLDLASQDHEKKKLINYVPFELPKRLWSYFLNKAGISEDNIWEQLKGRSQNKLIHILTNDEYSVSGKTTFKEEFVTAGGVSLIEVEVESMQSKIVPALYFAGEVLDIDGVTGGFNFQAAWTTGFIAGKCQAV